MSKLIELAEDAEQFMLNALNTAIASGMSVDARVSARRSAADWATIAAALRSRAAREAGDEQR